MLTLLTASYADGTALQVRYAHAITARDGTQNEMTGMGRLLFLI
jgi:hypothetical protein